MKKNDVDELSRLKPSQYIGMSEVISSLSEAVQLPRDETKEALNTFDLPELRPVIYCWLSDYYTVRDTTDRKITKAITHQLAPLNSSELSDREEEFAAMVDFQWPLPTLIHWCKKHQLPVPEDWKDWIQTTYPILREHGLLMSGLDESQQASNINRPKATGRELQKSRTQNMHQNWKEEYKHLKREHPGKSDVWISKKIAKMPIAQGRDSETIRKIMKKRQ